MSLVGVLRGPAEWLDMDATLPALMTGAMTASDWPRLAVSTAPWVLVPLGFGLWRTRPPGRRPSGDPFVDPFVAVGRRASAIMGP